MDLKGAFDDQEERIGIIMTMPDKLTAHFHRFDLEVITLGDNFRCPSVRTQGKFLSEVRHFRDYGINAWQSASVP